MKVTGRGKYQDLVSSLRGDIVDGVYAPGNRLPNRSKLVDEFGVSMATVQKAIDSLMVDGFVESRSRAGTFVVDHPPHLCNYGFLLPGHGQWSLYFRALREAAGIIEKSKDVHLCEYLTSSDVALRRGVMQLSRDVVSSKLGGLIIVTPLHDIEATPALKQIGLPRVFVNRKAEKGLPTVAFDVWGSFLPRAVEYLTSLGCRRIGHMRLSNEISDADMLHKTLADAGVEQRSYWEQSVFGKVVNEIVSNTVELMMQLDGDKRPDSLIIYDDNLVDGVMAGLMAAGVKVPQEIKIVAHCNYPSPVKSAFPIKRLGFDCCELLRECLKIIDMIRDGQSPAEYTKIPAMFDNEINAEV